MHIITCHTYDKPLSWLPAVLVAKSKRPGYSWCGAVEKNIIKVNRLCVSNIWLGVCFCQSSFCSFYVLIYCLTERVSIVRKTKVRNHRRVPNSPSAKFKYLRKRKVLHPESSTVFTSTALRTEMLSKFNLPKPEKYCVDAVRPC